MLTQKCVFDLHAFFQVFVYYNIRVSLFRTILFIKWHLRNSKKDSFNENAKMQR